MADFSQLALVALVAATLSGCPEGPQLAKSRFGDDPPPSGRAAVETDDQAYDEEDDEEDDETEVEDDTASDAPASPLTATRRPTASDDIKADARAALAAARDQLKLEQPKQAIGPLRRVISLLPDEPEGHLLLGRALLMVDNPKDAVPAFRKAVALNPTNPEIRYGLAVSLARTGQSREAMLLARALNKERPDDARVAALLSEGARRVEGPEARAALAAAHATQNTPESAARLGRAAAREGDFAAAANHLAVAAKARPDDLDLQLQYGTALGKSGRLGQAEIVLDALTRKDPTQQAGWRNLAAVMEQQGDAQGAIRAWKGLVKQLDGVEKANVQNRIYQLEREGLKP
ncbi:MAG: tetratricopeptide repeat protein [Bradymonadia bacterium]